MKTIIFNLPVVRKEIEKANTIQEDQNEQVLNREKIIAEKTKELKDKQAQLLILEEENTRFLIQSLSVELTGTEERERCSIADDLQNTIAPSLNQCIAELRNITDSNPPGRKKLIEIKDDIETATNHIRSLTFQLSPPVLYDFGLEAAIDWLVRDINSRHDLNITFKNELSNSENVIQTHKVNIFRAVRELLTNVVKHSKATSAVVCLFKELEKISLVIEDDGIGFNPDRMIKANKAYGLQSIKKRIEAIGGTFDVYSVKGKGSAISLLFSEKEMFTA